MFIKILWVNKPLKKFFVDIKQEAAAIFLKIIYFRIALIN